jgi:hypothetical protein
MPKAAESWSLTSLREKLVKIGFVLASARIGEGIGTCIGEAQRIVQLPTGEQLAIRGDCGAAKLEHQTAVEIEPQRTPIGLHRRVCHLCFRSIPTRY